jgi:hypothetical protein
MFREMDRRVAIAAACVSALILAGWLFFGHQRAAAAVSPVSPADRAAGLSFEGVAPADRAWIEAAIAKARPEAATLIDEVDGLVTIKTASAPNAPWVGITGPSGDRYTVGFNLAYLDGERAADRDVTVLHELGHVIDFVLVDDAERDRMAAEVPVSGTCFTADTGDCTAPAERFADTFAKWALRGAVSAVGAGYGVPMPASIEDWGAPLGILAARLSTASA